jgi:hypothetical protein
MSSSKGPRPGPVVRRVPARTLPLKKPFLSAEALRLCSDRPLRRPPPRPERTRKPRTLTPADVDRGLEAAARGEAFELAAQPQQLPVRLAPAVRDVIERSGLSREGVARLHGLLADVLGNSETVQKLPRWRERSDCGLYGTALSSVDAAHVFTFVVLAGSESTPVLVAACEHERIRRS